MILKADKNSTIIVIDKDDYIKEGLRQLSSIHYTEVTDTPYQAELANRLMKTINELLELSQTKQPTDSCHRQLNRIGGGKCTYSPKVHKLLSDEISQAETHSLKSLNKTLPGQPIIAQCGSSKYYIGKLIDIFLLPTVKRQNTYIRDTPHVPGIPELHPVCQYDCTSMYTNMEFSELKQAVNDVLPHAVSCPRPNNRVQKHHLVQLVEIPLTNNYFSFNDKLYHQTIGASKGAIPSPEMHDIRLHQILEHLIENSPHKDKIITHVRFRDDGFMIWENATKEELTNFFHTANSFHHLLKFTHTVSKQEITFLDTTVYTGKRFTSSRVLDIKTHTKPTETYQYLHRTSCHPNSVFRGFIKGTVISRIRTNSDPDSLKSALINFKNKLTEGGYKTQETDQYFSEALLYDRKSLFADRPENNKMPLVYITKYHPHLKNMRKALTKGWDRINNSSLQQLFPNSPTIAFQRNKTIEEMLSGK